MNADGWLADLADSLLPARLRRELRIGDVRTDLYQGVIVFRMDPDQLFERQGIIFPTRSGPYITSVGQRHRPDDELMWLADGAGVSARGIAGELRSAISHARLASTGIPHWQAAGYRPSAFILDWPLGSHAPIAAATDTAASRARYTGSTHFTFQRDNRAYAASTPPPDGTFFSITPQGLWATHRGARTAPIPEAPGACLFTPPPAAKPRQLAAADQPEPGQVRKVPEQSPSSRKRSAPAADRRRSVRRLTMSAQERSPAVGFGVILPADLSSELCIANLTSTAGGLLVFRIDPGDAFERRAFIRSGSDGRFHLGIREMYLPDGLYRSICGADGIPADDIPDQLRTLSGYAYTQATGRRHWTQARRTVRPVRSGSQWAAAPRSADLATEAAAYCAKQADTTYYLHLSPGRYRYANNPPDRPAFYSVTPSGLWSDHDGTATYPLGAAPGETAFADRDQQRQARTAALIAGADQPLGELIVGPFPRPGDGARRRTSRTEPRRRNQP